MDAVDLDDLRDRIQEKTARQYAEQIAARQAERVALAPQKPQPSRSRPKAERKRSNLPAERWRNVGRPQTEATRSKLSTTMHERWVQSVDAESLPAITRARIERGWSIHRTARECGLSVPTLQRMAAGLPVRARSVERAVAVFGEGVRP
jgi:AraC-like DNA-binding protein